MAVNEEGCALPKNVDGVSQKARSKKTAFVVVTVILAALVVVAALAAVDYDAILGRITGSKLPTPQYYEPDYNENIFENKEYMQYAYAEMQIAVKEEGNYSKVYPFGDSDSAEEAFGKAGEHRYGAGVLSDYFYTLLRGCNSKAKRERFFGLFSEEYQIKGKENSAPGAFPAQKIYDLYFEYRGEEKAYDGTPCYQWYVSYKIVRNDGTVLNYSSGADGGEARFYLEQLPDGSCRIKEIVGIFKLN